MDSDSYKYSINKKLFIYPKKERFLLFHQDKNYVHIYVSHEWYLDNLYDIWVVIKINNNIDFDTDKINFNNNTLEKSTNEKENYADE